MTGKVFWYSFLVLLGMFLLTEGYIHIFGNYCEPWFDKQTRIIKRKKNTEGRYKTDYTNSGYFKINNEGWNSHRDYYGKENAKSDTEKNKKFKLRIAIIGHSNIEGLRVLVDKTLSKVFEEDMNKNGINTEVYTFGFGGMHLAQALHVSQYVVKKFQPDFIFIGTLLDDFLAETTTKPNFLALNVKSNHEVQEILPEKYTHEESSFFTFLYFSKAIKYADIKTGIGKKILSLLNYRKKLGKTKKLSSNCIEENRKTLIGFNYIIQKFTEISYQPSGYQIPIFFINFPITIPSYNYDFQKVQLPDKQLNRIQFVDIIQKHQFKVLDLEQAFADDFSLNGEKFDFTNDYHYNEHAHRVIGKYLSNYFQLYLNAKP